MDGCICAIKTLSAIGKAKIGHNKSESYIFFVLDAAAVIVTIFI